MRDTQVLRYDSVLSRPQTPRMKQLIILLLITIAFSSQAQKTVKFAVILKPEKTYRTVVTTDMSSELNFEGNQEMVDQMKANGITLPVIMTGRTEYGAVTTTSAKLKDGRLPVKIHYATVAGTTIVNGKEMQTQPNPLEDLTLLGHYDTKNLLKIDSIAGSSFNAQMEQMIISMVEKFQALVVFPEKPLKVGDTFEQKVPMDLPMAGVTIKININILYTLKSIDNGFARFDVEQTLSLATNMPDAKMDLSGGGKGTVDFDVNNTIMSAFTTDMDLKLKMVVKEMTVDSSVKTSTKQVMTIE